MKKIHYTDRYLLNPYHPVTVFVIGAGGTGSQVATGLARISVALQALGHPGTARDGLRPRYPSRKRTSDAAVQRIGTRIEQGCGTCDPHQPFFGFSWEAKGSVIR